MTSNKNYRYEEAKRRRLERLAKGIVPHAKTIPEMLIKMGIRATDPDATTIAEKAIRLTLKAQPGAERSERVALKKERKQVDKQLKKKPPKGDVKATKSRVRKTAQVAVAA